MEERLAQIGEWLKVNGEAIYETEPWTSTRQWGAGKVPAADYDKTHEAAYDVMTLVTPSQPGRAAIEAFFTAKGNEVYAILPRWPGRRFVARNVKGVKTVALLGSDVPLSFSVASEGVAIDLPDVPESLRAQPAWVLKLGR